MRYSEATSNLHILGVLTDMNWRKQICLTKKHHYHHWRGFSSNLMTWDGFAFSSTSRVGLFHKHSPTACFVHQNGQHKAPITRTNTHFPVLDFICFPDLKVSLRGNVPSYHCSHRSACGHLMWLDVTRDVAGQEYFGDALPEKVLQHLCCMWSCGSLFAAFLFQWI